MLNIVTQDSLNIPLVQAQFQAVLCALRSADLDEAETDTLWERAWHAIVQPHPARQLRELQALQAILHRPCAIEKAVAGCLT
jgi:hypothetical protein